MQYSTPYVVPQPVVLQDQKSAISYDNEDYRLWSPSKLALTFLILLLLMFSAILCLSIWQANSDIQGVKDGIPRDTQLERATDEQESGIKRYKRDIRLVVCFFAIIVPVLAFLVYIVPASPTARTGVNYVLAVILILLAILALIAFALDVNSERDAFECNLITEECESLEALATPLGVLDGLVFVLSLAGAILLAMYSSSGDWSRENDIAQQYNPAAILPGNLPNGRSAVRKTCLSLLLFALLCVGVILLTITLLIHEERMRWEFRDSNNRIAVGDRPGWPRRNTAMRYAVCSMVILTVLFNFVPLNSRVLALVLGFLYFCYAILAFVAFGLDVDSLSSARDDSTYQCDGAVKQTIVGLGEIECSRHPYIATAVLEFLGGFVLIVFLILEYGVLRMLKGRAQ